MKDFSISKQHTKTTDKLWYSGANYTVDSVVITRDSLLLIQRSDNGKWALPGGFIDADETALAAGRRELFEETGLALDENPTEIYRGPVDDPRSTPSAWIETVALLWQINQPSPVRAGDDAAAAEWFSLDDLPDKLHGSHAEIIAKARQFVETEAQRKTVSGGHMGYRRSIVSGQFEKRHNPAKFSDAASEKHSRQYLKKEAEVYRHLAQFDFAHAPRNTRLTDGALTMEALDSDDGWQWRAPTDKLQNYLGDVFSALDDLAQIPIVEDASIRPSQQTFWREGWGDFANKRQQIIRKLENCEQPGAADLAANLDVLATLAYKNFQQNNDAELVFCHHDFRQSNIAWQEKTGARIVDWSWAGAGEKNADATSLLIDLHKFGHEIDEHLDKFNDRHALNLLGFWLCHSVWPTCGGDQTVRQQQIASSIAAYQLLQRKNALA